MKIYVAVELILYVVIKPRFYKIESNYKIKSSVSLEENILFYIDSLMYFYKALIM